MKNDKVLQFRFDELVQSKLDFLVESYGFKTPKKKNYSKLIRHLISKADDTAYDQNKIDALFKEFSNLSRLGNNLNQFNRHLSRRPDDFHRFNSERQDELQRTIYDIQDQLKDIHKLFDQYLDEIISEG